MVQLVRVHRMYPFHQAVDSRLIQTALLRSSHDCRRQCYRGVCHPLGSSHIHGRCLAVFAGAEVLAAVHRGIVHRPGQILLRTADPQHFDRLGHSHHAIEGCMGSTHREDAETFAFRSLHGWRTVSCVSRSIVPRSLTTDSGR